MVYWHDILTMLKIKNKYSQKDLENSQQFGRDKFEDVIDEAIDKSGISNHIVVESIFQCAVMYYREILEIDEGEIIDKIRHYCKNTSIHLNKD